MLMKVTLWLATFAIWCLVSACANGEPDPVKGPLPQPPSPTASLPKDGNYNGKGIVAKIDFVLEYNQGTEKIASIKKIK